MTVGTLGNEHETMRYMTTGEWEHTHSGAAVYEAARDFQHVRVFSELQEVPLQFVFVLRHFAELHLQPL